MNGFPSAVLGHEWTTQAIVGNGCALKAENGTITVKAEDATSLNLKTGNVTVGGTAAIRSND